MLAELLDKIQELTDKAHGPHVTKIPGGPDHQFLLCHGGDCKVATADPAPRRHQALSLDSLTEFTNAAAGGERPVVVWYSREGVVALLDDGTRRDRVTLPLAFSDPMKMLQQLDREPKRTWTQRDLIFLLRTTFARCLGPAGDLLNVLRRIKFHTNQSGESEVGRGKASLGKQIESELTGTGELPEYVTFQVPVFTNPLMAWPFTVECALEPDPATATFRLIPLPGEIERVVQAAETNIGGALGDQLNNVPAYYGVP